MGVNKGKVSHVLKDSNRELSPYEAALQARLRVSCLYLSIPPRPEDLPGLFFPLGGGALNMGHLRQDFTRDTELKRWDPYLWKKVRREET